MPNNSNNIERQRNIINKLKALLEKYTKIYDEDGIRDCEEQASINEMNEKIARAEDHLAKLESGEITPTTSTDKEVPDDKTTIGEGKISSDLDPEVLDKKRRARDEQLTKMEMGTQKMETAMKKKAATPEQIEKAIAKYEAALEKIRTKALEDGKIDEQEQLKIDLVQGKLDKLREQLNGTTEETTDETVEDTSVEEVETTSEEEVIEETPEELEETSEVEGNTPEEEPTTEEPVSTGPITREQVTAYETRLKEILERLGVQ